MKFILYNLLFAAVYPFLLPGFLVRMLRRGGYAARMGDRFALYPETVKERFALAPPVGGHGKRLEKSGFVWIHAVSVGEVQVAGQLMREWRAVEPGVKFCFSTTSSTGWKMAEREVGAEDVLIYNPLDFPNFVKSALLSVRPRAIVLTESEIWPNFILTAKKYGIPTYLVNARVSDRSAPRYRAAKFFFGEVLSSFTRIFAQSELDRARLVAAGAPAERVEVTGSFKFDVAHRNPVKEAELGAWLFGPEGRPAGLRILLGGSTWPGEDEFLLKVYRTLVDRARATGAVTPWLVLAPRHFEKADAVEANIVKAGFACCRRSRTPHPAPSTKHQAPSTPPPVFLSDTTGELMGLYGIADVVFVGKSLCAHGSQNMIEPCLCGKPTFVGPFTENFRPVMSDLLESEAIVQARDAEDLSSRLLAAFSSEGDQEMARLSARATAAVERRRGVVAKCLASIRRVCLVFAILPLLAGCLTATDPEISHWPVEYRSVKAAQPSAARPEGIARLTQLAVRSPYNRDALTVLRADGTVAFDPFNEYADQPMLLLRGPVIDALSASGLFKSVVGGTSKVREDAQIEIVVTRLALDCRKEGERKAVVEILMRLVKDETIVRTATGAASADAVGGNYGEAFSQAFSSALLDATERVR